MDWSSFWFLVIFLSIFLVPLVVIPLWLQVHTAKKRKEQRDKLLNQAVLYFLHNRFHPEDSQSLSYQSMLVPGSGADRLVRNIQIIRDSIDIILTSKNKDTIESRVEAINQCGKVVAQFAYIVSPDVRAEIQRVVDTSSALIKSQAYVNIANGHIQKSLTMKTQKARSKYALQALEVIEDGLSKPESDQDALLELKGQAQLLLAE